MTKNQQRKQKRIKRKFLTGKQRIETKKNETKLLKTEKENRKEKKLFKRANHRHLNS